MKRLIGTIWRWSLLVTLPTMTLFAIWAWNVTDRYSSFGLKLPEAAPFSLEDVGRMEFHHLLRQLAINLQPTLETKSEGIRQLSLFVDAANLAGLDANLPYSGQRYVDGSMYYDGTIHPVDIRYRGDSYYHWGYYKKSFRIKTKRDKLFEGIRRLNLLAPRTPGMLNNHFSYLLGAQLGLMAPRSEMIELTVNGENQGIFNLVEQLDESTLRSLDRMPGDLYSGDLVGMDRPQGVTNLLFDHLGLWQKKAVNNHYSEASKAPLQRLLKVVSMPPSEERDLLLERTVNISAFARFSALELLSSSIHTDSIHNWRLYYDPATSKFEPVVWDFMGWNRLLKGRGLAAATLDTISSPLHLVLYHNRRFLLERQRVLETFFRSGADDEFLDSVDQQIEQLKAAVSRDPNAIVDTQQIWPSQIVEAMHRHRELIASLFEWIERNYMSASQLQYRVLPTSGEIALLAKGRAPIKNPVLEFENSLTEIPTASLSFWKNGERQSIDVSQLLTIRTNRVALELDLLPNYDFSIQSMRPSSILSNRAILTPSYWQLDIENMGTNNELVQISHTDPKSLSQLAALRVKNIEIKDLRGPSLLVPEANSRPRIWSNVQEIPSGVLEIDADLTIRAGTLVKLHPNASIILKGRLRALGTKENPIRFEPYAEDQAPWGAIVLLGQGANHSSLNHTVFSGGSGLKEPLREYSAMLSVHDVEDVVVSDSTFRDNELVDDMVHTVYSQVRFERSVFLNALSDALDLDISRAYLEECVFENSGNDGIDLMATNAVIVKSSTSGNKDKGISVGEGSSLVVIDSQFVGNQIGMQVKDGSRAISYNSTFQQNLVALDGYKKNWRYNAGGSIFVYKTAIFGSQTVASADKHSKLWFHDSFIEDVSLIDARRRSLYLDSTSDSDEAQHASEEGFWRFKEDEDGEWQVPAGLWEKGNPEVRGHLSTGSRDL